MSFGAFHHALVRQLRRAAVGRVALAAAVAQLGREALG